MIVERDEKEKILPCNIEVNIENNDNIICIRMGQIEKDNKQITGIGIKISLYPLYNDDEKRVIATFD